MERSRKIAVGGIDVRRVLGSGFGRRDPTTWREHQTIWRGTRMISGPASYRVRWHDGSVAVSAWGEGADEVLERMPAMLGLEDRPEEFTTDHPLVAQLAHSQPGLRLGHGKRIVDVLIRTILGQRVTAGEAHSAYRRLVFDNSEHAPGPNKVWLPPDPARLRRKRAFELMGDDLDAKRAATIIRSCVHFKKLDKRQDEPAEEVAAFLQLIPGIGPWTAIGTIAETHGWPDAVQVGDYHLPNLVSFALAGEPRGTDARMIELLEPFKGQRHRVIRLLGRSGVTAPRYGAKKASWGFYVDRGTRRHEKG